MEWPAIIIAAIIAAAAILVAFLVDWEALRKRRQTLSSAPDEPRLAEAGTPQYVIPQDVRPDRVRLTDERKSEIKAKLESATQIEGGWASADFVTDKPSMWAVIDSPVVIVADHVTDMRQIYPAIKQAKDANVGIVVVAGTISTPVVADLALNHLAGTLTCVAVTTKDLDTVALSVSGHVISVEDLMSGYIPDGTFGTCSMWVSGRDQSWIIV